MELTGHTGPINSVRFSRQGTRLISGSDDMAIKIWDTNTGLDCMHIYGHKKKVWAVVFSPDERTIIFGSEDKTIRVWDATDGTLIGTLVDHKSGINAVVLLPNNTLLASSSFDDEGRLWDAKTWNLIGKLGNFGHTKSGTLTTQTPDPPSHGDVATPSSQMHRGRSKEGKRLYHM